ncbi:MAG: 50S ribosomal protein L25 [Candidatus Adiutrix intracellularis]|nr:50S ribosomal protein L25 [Candidatus Adiutrix intracellularis]
MGLSTILNAKQRDIKNGPRAGSLRRQGLLPAVFYGPGLKMTQSLSLNYKEFKTALTISPGNRTLYTLMIEGQSPQVVLLKDFQVDALSRKAIHADFYLVNLTKPVTVKVPVILNGKPVGVEKGGQLQPGVREVLVSTLPDQAPTEVTVDVSDLALGQSLHLSQMKVQGEYRLVFTTDLPVATVVTPKGFKAEVEGVVEGAATIAVEAAIAPAGKVAPKKAAKTVPKSSPKGRK